MDSKQVKVLMLVENNSYPSDVRVQREALALEKAGFKVAVISPHHGKSPYHEKIGGVSVYRYAAPPEGDGLFGYLVEYGYSTLAMLLVSFWAWWSHGFDIIHTANPPDTLFVIAAFYKLFGKKFVFDQHDLSPETYLSRYSKTKPGRIYKILIMLERLSFSLSNRVIVPNESYRRIAIARGKIDPNKVFIVRNGVSLDFQLTQKDDELARRARFIIGYIGIIGPQDGVDYWLRAIYELVNTLDRKDFLAVIIGQGDAVPSLKKLAGDLQIEPYIWFTGHISDEEVLRYLSTTHICVHPDPLNPLNNWSSMNKMMDYMALGKPVVSFDLVEARFSAQSAALYAQPNDELDFAQKVAYLMEREDERIEMGKFGRKRFEEVLAWEHSSSRLLDVYRSFSNGHEQARRTSKLRKSDKDPIS